MNKLSSFKLSILIASFLGVAITAAQFISGKRLTWNLILPGLAGMFTSAVVMFLILRFGYKRK